VGRGPAPTTCREFQQTSNLTLRDWKFGVTVGNGRSGVRSLAGEEVPRVGELLSDALVLGQIVKASAGARSDVECVHKKLRQLWRMCYDDRSSSHR
jgi:hypothetical protein